MTTVAIIAEYNPFHSGHLYHINEIRREFGEDTAIVAIMSGNFTQRGEVAFADKLIRAKCAVECGINLVLELPFPYSMSSADLFARSGIHIANMLGNIDYLSFGSENGDLSTLKEISEIMSSKEYNNSFKLISSDKSLGYAKTCELAYRNCAAKDISFDFIANNILAIEYIKALNDSKSNIKPHTVKRIGADYISENIIEKIEHQSATAIRNQFLIDPEKALTYLPNDSGQIIKESYTNNELPCDGEKLSSAIISHYRLSSAADGAKIHDAGNGLYNRLITSSVKAANISSLISLTETKKFTNARIRRTMWYGFLGVTSSDVKTKPRFTQILAMDKIGISILKSAQKNDSFSILTKPADYSHFDDIAIHQKRLSEKADSVFELTKPIPKPGNTALKLTPFIKK